jgi:hypothetical protein
MVRLLAKRLLTFFLEETVSAYCYVQNINHCTVTAVFSREWDAMRDLIEGDMQLLEKTFRYPQGGGNCIGLVQ